MVRSHPKARVPFLRLLERGVLCFGLIGDMLTTIPFYSALYYFSTLLPTHDVWQA